MNKGIPALFFERGVFHLLFQGVFVCKIYSIGISLFTEGISIVE
jgi:hypothetical protein